MRTYKALSNIALADRIIRSGATFTADPKVVAQFVGTVLVDLGEVEVPEVDPSQIPEGEELVPGTVPDLDWFEAQDYYVSHLHSICLALGIGKSGSKADIIQRLIDRQVTIEEIEEIFAAQEG